MPPIAQRKCTINFWRTLKKRKEHSTTAYPVCYCHLSAAPRCSTQFANAPEPYITRHSRDQLYTVLLRTVWFFIHPAPFILSYITVKCCYNTCFGWKQAPTSSWNGREELTRPKTRFDYLSIISLSCQGLNPCLPGKKPMATYSSFDYSYYSQLITNHPNYRSRPCLHFFTTQRTKTAELRKLTSRSNKAHSESNTL